MARKRRRFTAEFKNRMALEAREDGAPGTPEIFNTDQGARFTSVAFIERVQEAGAQRTMDGRGRYLDNAYIEGLVAFPQGPSRVSVRAFGRLASQVRHREWIEFYNHRRPHSALDGRTPVEAYRPEQVI